MVDVSMSLLGGAGWQFFDDSGDILAAGRIYTYEAGGSTPAATYADSSGNTSNGVYVQLDSAGRPSAEIWLLTTQNYKFTVKKFVSSGVYSDIRTYDNIPGATPASAINQLVADLASPVAGKGSDMVNFSGKTITPSTVTATTISTGSLTATGNTALGDSDADIVSAKGRITLGAVSGPMSFGDLQYCGIQNFGRYQIDGNYAAIQHTTDTSCALFGFFKARGTQASPVAIANGDDVGELSFHGWDGTTFVKGGLITPIVDGVVSPGIMPTSLRFWTMNTSGALTLAATIKPDQSSEFKGSVKVQGQTLGYDTGAGGTITQATSKTTAVTLNKASGQITMNNAALASGAEVTFQFNNSLIDNEDNILLSVTAGAAGWYNYQVKGGSFASGSCQIAVKNLSGGSLSEAVVLNFTILKGATA